MTRCDATPVFENKCNNASHTFFALKDLSELAHGNLAALQHNSKQYGYFAQRIGTK
jgi:hypothetical protein